MNYEVEWTEEVELRLAAVWEAAADRRQVTEASYQIERRLQRYGASAGELLSEGMYAIEDGPLRMLFTVDSRRIEIVAIKATQTG